MAFQQSSNKPIWRKMGKLQMLTGQPHQTSPDNLPPVGFAGMEDLEAGPPNPQHNSQSRGPKDRAALELGVAAIVGSKGSMGRAGNAVGASGAQQSSQASGLVSKIG